MLPAYSLRGLDAFHIGYGAMTARLADALAGRVELRDDAESVVFGLMPNMVKGWLAGQRAACLTMWETDVPPPLFRRLLPFFDKVLVPSTFCADLFAGMSRDIGVVPLGVDRDVWKPGKVPSGQFTFITGGSSWPRKGIQQVMDAFVAADLPDARLLVKLPDYVAEMPERIKVPDGVTIIQKKLPLDAEVALYQSADCFVSGSRGEGFGMIPLQNVAVGNLVIAPGHTGHGDFADLFDYNLSWTKQPAELKNWPDTGNWFVPDFDEMVDAMRDAFQRGRLHWASRQKRWRSTAAWTWDSAADRLLDLFPAGGLVTSTRLVRMEPPVTVRALRRVEADIGAHRIRADAGTVFDVPASTVPQLIESGLVTEL
jgi:glycosyltransferase involved in cell wall biosynthesis